MLLVVCGYKLKALVELDEHIETLKQPTLIGIDRDRATEQCLANLARFSDQVKNILSRLPAHDQRLYSDVRHLCLYVVSAKNR